jgi:hypothetical protein
MRSEDGRGEQDDVAVKLLSYIPETFNSNLRQDNRYPGMMVVFLSSFGQLLGQHLVQATTGVFQFILNRSSHYSMLFA